MTKLLLKLFVRDYANKENSAVRGKVGTLSGIVGILANAILCVGKLIIGTVSGSVSITADAMNNLSDAASSIVTLVGFKLAVLGFRRVGARSRLHPRRPWEGERCS